MDRMKCECGNDEFNAVKMTETRYHHAEIQCTKCGKTYGLPWVVNVPIHPNSEK